MSSHHSSFRRMGPHALDAAFQEARQSTLGLFEALAAAGHDRTAQVPRLPILNLPLWELGHIAWFAEWFVLREARSSQPGEAIGPSLLAAGDSWFDSNTVAHATRWALTLPAPDAIKLYCRDVLDSIRARLARTRADDAALYPYRLVLAHEDMHGEALTYTLQTLGVLPPGSGADSTAASLPPCPGAELTCAGGSFLLGGDQSSGFTFDNERRATACRVAPFTIDADLVSNAAYLAFMHDGGYTRHDYWSAPGRTWLRESGRTAPRYWQRDGAGWITLRFGRPTALDPAEPVRHVSLHEAQAYCNWAGRRLPLEHEWEFAATASHGRFAWGRLWEWTASRFLPYADFTADRYREYSAPYFGRCQALRGASFATPARLRSPHFRNFYLPERDDIFAGFRTCAR